MTRFRTIGRWIALAFVLALCYAAWSFIATYQRLPEAYAAWDTGTLLVAYMSRNDDEWPSSWDDLAKIIDLQNNCPKIRGFEGRAEDTIEQLKTYVIIDFAHRPQAGTMAYPITDSRGKRFRTVWDGAEPNEMVYRWITHRYREDECR